jgi:hypothetical protein
MQVYLVLPPKKKRTLGLLDLLLQPPPITRSPPLGSIHDLCLLLALDHRVKRDLARVERRRPAQIRVAGKYHYGGVGREGRVEGDELRAQRGLGSRERFWRRLCRRGCYNRCIRRRFRLQPCPNNSDQSSPTHPSTE